MARGRRGPESSEMVSFFIVFHAEFLLLNHYLKIFCTPYNGSDPRFPGGGHCRFAITAHLQHVIKYLIKAQQKNSTLLL